MPSLHKGTVTDRVGASCLVMYMPRAGGGVRKHLPFCRSSCNRARIDCLDQRNLLSSCVAPLAKSSPPSHMEQIFRCQSCRAKLDIGGMDSLGGAEAAQTSSGYRHTPSANSALGGSKVDESFIVLDNGSKKGAQGDTVNCS